MPPITVRRYTPEGDPITFRTYPTPARRDTSNVFRVRCRPRNATQRRKDRRDFRATIANDLF